MTTAKRLLDENETVIEQLVGASHQGVTDEQSPIPIAQLTSLANQFFDGFSPTGFDQLVKSDPGSFDFDHQLIDPFGDVSVVRGSDPAEFLNPMSVLTIADVEDFVLPNSRNYHRSRVVSNDHYELLIMTWLPGQASAPHDHAGSICVMQVLQGNAIETSYRVAADGYIDLEFESRVKTDQITSGQDAGIHSVRNSSESEETLVTVHIYSPPLRDFRRFVERPRQASSVRSQPDSKSSLPSVLIVGGGFSGAMTAAHLLNRARREMISLEVTLVERRGAIGEGVAYGTRDLSHLLNVPAGRMSAWPKSPNDFLDWANQNEPMR